jgi:hypothetical protein
MVDSTDDMQPTLWEWQGGDAERIDEAVTRGTLDLSELPGKMRDCRPRAHRLHVRLERLLGTVDLVVTDNRRRMMSTRRRRNRQEVRLHHMFLGCPQEVVAAVADLAGGRTGARETIQQFIDDNRDAIRFEPDDDELRPKGRHFDLEVVLSEVRALFDEEAAAAELDDIHITWGRRGRGTKSIRFGSYDFDRRLIRVHPALDREWVPRYFVRFIVYHELLHAIFPPEAGCGRRNVHTAEFRAMEKRFPDYQRAMQWESANLRRVLDHK